MINEAPMAPPMPKLDINPEQQNGDTIEIFDPIPGADFEHSIHTNEVPR
jgi:hypothetical protein